jgi:hypothetical protein
LRNRVVLTLEAIAAKTGRALAAGFPALNISRAGSFIVLTFPVPSLSIRIFKMEKVCANGAWLMTNATANGPDNGLAAYKGGGGGRS